MNEWPFDQPRNCGTIISRGVLAGTTRIFFVSHDEDDHAWQFLDDETTESKQAALVCLEDIVEIDPSVLEVADLEPGWVATRSTPNDPWVRMRSTDTNEP
jgi:hypothetical protein